MVLPCYTMPKWEKEMNWQIGYERKASSKLFLKVHLDKNWAIYAPKGLLVYLKIDLILVKYANNFQ